MCYKHPTCISVWENPHWNDCATWHRSVGTSLLGTVCVHTISHGQIQQKHQCSHTCTCKCWFKCHEDTKQTQHTKHVEINTVADNKYLCPVERQSN